MNHLYLEPVESTGRNQQHAQISGSLLRIPRPSRIVFHLGSSAGTLYKAGFGLVGSEWERREKKQGGCGSWVTCGPFSKRDKRGKAARGSASGPMSCADVRSVHLFILRCASMQKARVGTSCGRGRHDRNAGRSATAHQVLPRSFKFPTTFPTLTSFALSASCVRHLFLPDSSLPSYR